MSYSNPAARLGEGTNNLAQLANYPLTRYSNDYQLLLSLYRCSWIIRKVVDVLAEDMLKDFPRITSEITPSQMKQFDGAAKKTATHAKLLEALKWGRLFGGAVAVICIKGHKNLSEPLDPDAVELGSYRGLIPLDRWSGVTPDAELVEDLDNPAEWGLPKYYQVDLDQQGKSVKIHHSRLLRFVGRDLPNWEKQVQMYWGLSEVELVFDELRKRDYTSWNIVSLVTRAQILTVEEPELAQALSGLGMSADALQQYVTRMQAISDSMNNQGLLTLGKDSKLFSTSYGFGGLAEIYNTFMLDVAGACEIPVSRLYGRTITGLGQSGEGDLQVYYDTVEQKRKRELRPQFDKLFPIVAMSTWGKVPDDLDYQFPPVRTLTEKDKADLGKSNMDSIIAAFNAGIWGRQTALKEIKQQAEVTGIGSNITDEMIESADDDVNPMGELGAGGENPLESVERSVPTPEPEGQRPKAKKKEQAAKDSAVVEQRTWQGIPVSIEYRKGTRRTLRNPEGNVVYDRLLQHHYGFIPNTVGRDGDEIDAILGPQDSGEVYVVAMMDLGPDVEQRDDEDKVLMGFGSQESALQAFSEMYGADWIGGVEAIPVEQFKTNWLGIV